MRLSCSVSFPEHCDSKLPSLLIRTQLPDSCSILERRPRTFDEQLYIDDKQGDCFRTGRQVRERAEGDTEYPFGWTCNASNQKGMEIIMISNKEQPDIVFFMVTLVV
jgi:hypothetical protein